MSEKNVCETIIVGGGISGLSCAHQLTLRGKDFRLLTEDVGGRIFSPEGDPVNYGAYYIAAPVSGYRKFVTLGERIVASKTLMCGADTKNFYTASVMDFIRNIGPSLYFLSVLVQFGIKYRRFLARCERMQQTDALRADTFLRNLYFQTAEEFVQKHGLEKHSEKFLKSAFWGQTFSTLDEISAFVFLQLCMPLLIPTYAFTFKKPEMTAPFKEKILYTTVETIHEKSGIYEIHTKSGDVFYAKNLVMATPGWVTQKLTRDIFPLPEIKTSVGVHVFHLSGTLLDTIPKTKSIVFSAGDEFHSLVQHCDGTYLLYARTSSPDFSKVFSTWNVIGEKSWNPALTVRGSILIENHPRANLYLIGDHNVCGTEASYITGIYAGKTIT